jgi:hypothetical protein
MLKVTSPMSMGAWLLSGFSAAAAVATLDAWGLPVPRPVGTGAKGTAAVLGMPLATYTAALISNTAVPVWHDARRTLPVVFAAGAAASAGAAGMATTPPGDAAPARRLAVGGAAAELAAVAVMERRLAPRVARPYHEGKAQGLGRVAKGCLAAGCVASATAGARSLAGARIGAALVTAGAVLERWSVFTAGSQSAADPRATVDPQRARMAAGQQARH